MKFLELIVLLPCHSLEDFPVHHEGREAEGLLAAWTALWHPALVANAGRMPTWYRADAPPEDLTDRLLVVPQVCESLLLAGWVARAEAQGARVVRRAEHRAEVVSAALEALEEVPPVAEELVADFLALGYSFLTVELLTRQMRYMSHVDEVHLQNETVAAAQAAVAGNEEEAHDHLRRCFEVLLEARERFYPVDSYLIDLTLIAETTLGADLAEELNDPAPKNLLISGEVLDRLAESHPESFRMLGEAIERGTLSVLGGDWRERDIPLLPPESVLWELKEGRATYDRRLARTPRIYARRRYGLSPILPQILSKLGFDGVVHVTLDGGRFPNCDQSKTRWEGLDSSSIDVTARVPVDATEGGAFLGLSGKMGESMDHDHVAAVAFAHWPGKRLDYLGDLRRAGNYAAVMGKFVTLDSFFAHTDHPGGLSRFEADRYRAPYLRQAVAAGEPRPISRYADHQRRHLLAAADQSLATLAELLTSKRCSERADLLSQVERSSESISEDLAESSQEVLGHKLDAQLDTTGHRLVAAICGSDAVEGRTESSASAGCLVVNPSSFRRHVAVELPRGIPLPDRVAPVIEVQQRGGRNFAVVDVPGMGYAWIAGGKGAAPQSPSRKVPPLAEEHVLRNEFFEVKLDPETGAIRSIHDYRHRDNRLSQQLAFRLPAPRPMPGEIWRDPDVEALYSVMVADRMEVTSSGPAFGEIVTEGRLVNRRGERLAGFRQALQAWRGSRVLNVDIELDIDEPPGAEPWNSYYAARFAWADIGSEMRRSVGWTSQPTSVKRIEALNLVEVQSGDMRTAILTGGLPYHRYDGLRMMDTLLVARGESTRRFRLGIGIDLAHPMHEAIGLVQPVAVVPSAIAPPSGRETSWLFHIDGKNLLATHWETCWEEGRAVGFRARLLETEGRAGRFSVQCLRNVASARQTDYRGQTLVELPVEQDKISIDCAAYEWIEIEARWS